MTDLPAIISRAEAKAQGLSRYYTGKPCSKGHIALRNTASGGCFECRLKPLENRKTKLTKLPDGTFSADRPCQNCGSLTRNQFGQCRICVNARNKDRSRVYWREVVKGTEKQKEYAKRAYENHKPANFEASKRHCKKRKTRTPVWVTKEDIKAMRAFYKDCPKGWHVDHIVPLFGKMVCGLNLAVNLQLLPKYENVEKSNKFPTCQRSMQPAWFDDPK